MAHTTLTSLAAIAEGRWGLVTTAQAEAAGVSRQQMSRWSSNGVLERVAQGVYRMAGAPTQEHEEVLAAWLALGGATLPKTATGVSPVVAAGITAALMHDAGDFLLDTLDFVVPARRTTRLARVRLRIRKLGPEDVYPVMGLPTMTLERTIADLVDQWVDLSLIAGVVRDGVTSGRLISPDRLVAYLNPIVVGQKRVGPGAGGGTAMAHHLFELAGVFPTGWSR